MLTKILTLIFFIIAISFAVFYSVFDKEIHSVIPLSEPEVMTISKGMTINTFSKMLIEKKWIDSKLWLKIYIKLNPELSSLKQGAYLIPPGITYVELLKLLVEGKEHQLSITFIEGSTFKDWLAVLKASKNITHRLTDFSVKTIAHKLGLPHDNPEGLFFPDTYFFTVGTSDIEILTRANQRMTKELNELWKTKAKNLPYNSAYEALIMASIIEKESGLHSEHPIISSVFINRLNKKMRLQTDPTVIYGLGERYKGDIKRSHLREKTAYNTYRIDGLPPTPIAMPGIRALHASMNPKKTDFLYFVSDGFGKHVFTRSLKEHNKAVKQYLLATKHLR